MDQIIESSLHHRPDIFYWNSSLCLYFSAFANNRGNHEDRSCDPQNHGKKITRANIIVPALQPTNDDERKSSEEDPHWDVLHHVHKMIPNMEPHSKGMHALYCRTALVVAHCR